uniref:Uncharacterized protein n=1 Tax=Panagrolaimus davidi TaxID=227884 RepID=A0A914PQ06_9BILA
MYPIFNDIFALSGTVSFLILSGSTRKHYKAFYLCQKHSISVTVLTGSSVPKITKIRRNTQMMKVTFYNQPSVSTNSMQNIKG